MNKHAQALGRLGGKKTSEAKARAARENGKKPKRPRVGKIAKLIAKVPTPLLVVLYFGMGLGGLHLWAWCFGCLMNP